MLNTATGMMTKAKEWYSPSEIIFTRNTALWLIKHLVLLREGYWPPEASNYIDLPGTGSKKAYFETPIQYAAEIEARLEKCGLDGLILEAIECWEKSVASLANYFQKPEWVIYKRRKMALDYIASGFERKWHDTKKRRGKLYINQA